MRTWNFCPLLGITIFLIISARLSGAQPCNGAIEFRTTTEGSFTSNNGGQYPANTNCQWTIYPPTPTSVTVLLFPNFQLAAGDTVTVFYNGAQQAVYNVNQPAQGLISTPGATVRVVFQSDGQGNGAGFTGNFAIHYCYGTQSLNGNTGNFADGSGDSNYQHMSDCQWLIHGIAGQRTVIDFTQFDLEQNNDYLTVYDGPDTSSHLLASFTGIVRPNSVVGSIGADMLVRFYSDEDINGQGFAANFYRSQNVPNGTITGGATTVTTGTPPQSTCNINNPTGCFCPDGSQECDLLPDMTSSRQPIEREHYEYPGRLVLSNATPNVGWGPLEVHAVSPPECQCGENVVSCDTQLCSDGSSVKQKIVQTVYHKSGTVITSSNRTAGFMLYHPSHGHIHVDNWADLSLRKSDGSANPLNWPRIGTSNKVSFCLVNLGDCTSNYGYCRDSSDNVMTRTNIVNSGFGQYSGCTKDQGIYAGYLDIYEYTLPDMYINIPQGTCNGLYYVVSITDPDNKMLESREDNNWVAVPIYLTQQTDCGNSSIPVESNYTDCTVYPALDLPKRIPIDETATNGDTRSVITVTDDFNLAEVDITGVLGLHEYLGDNNFYLIAPDGTTVQLVQRRCGSSAAFQFSFTDRALSNSWPCPPTGGEWRPDFPLSVLNGKSSKGNWTLQVSDITPGDTGELQGWQLKLCRNPTNTHTQSSQSSQSSQSHSSTQSNTRSSSQTQDTRTEETKSSSQTQSQTRSNTDVTSTTGDNMQLSSGNLNMLTITLTFLALIGVAVATKFWF